MSRHRFMAKEKYSTDDLDDEYYEEDYGSYGSPMSPTSRMYMYSRDGKQAPVPEEPETDDELVSKCIQQIYNVLGKNNVHETRQQLETLVRDYNYSADAVVNHIMNSFGSGVDADAEEDEMFGMEMASSVRAPPGFKGPPANAPITKGENRSAMAEHFAQHPPEKKPTTAFAEPSPDDMVLDKQKQAFKKGGPGAGAASPAAKSNTGPAFVSGGKKAQAAAVAAAKAATAAEPSLRGSGELSFASGAAAQQPRASSSSQKPQKQMTDQKRAKTLAEIKQVKPGEKIHMSMVVIGHVDAGKSTLMGHLLYQSGFVSKQIIDRHEHEAKQRGKSSFHFAWVLDQHEEERNRGVTIDVATSYLETPKYRVTLLDAPGHRDFVPNMITGTAQADCAVLVVPAPPAEFERGWSEQGQTKEHALLARSLGVSQLIIAVNKMDTADWDQAKFEAIKEQMSPFLKRSGFKEENFWFVPLSGLTGENLTKQTEPKLKAWYSGPTLLERVDMFAAPEREVDKPFRLTIADVFRESGLAIGGKVETGFVTTGDKVVILPYGDPATVKSIRFNGQPVEYASAGSNVDITLNGIEATSISIGSVMCDPEQPVTVSKRFKAQILTFNLEMPLMRGHRLMLHTQNVNEPARLIALHGILERNGEIKQKKPRAIGEKMSALVEVATDHTICCELYSNIRALGRFMLRQEGRTVAAGIITEFVTDAPAAAAPASLAATNASADQ